MTVRRAVQMKAVVGITAVLALASITGCMGGKESDKPNDPKAPAPQSGASSGAADAPKSDSSTPAQILATVKGEAGMALNVTKAVRESGGFLTVEGELKNTGTAPFVNTAPWRGNELNSSGVSVAGVTLIDKAGKKRYYVLRDTDGRCLCTTGLAIIEAGQTVPFFAQFPAPPASATEVELSLPTFASATIKISG
ncbi:hypothetical protein ACYTFC_10510 [Streptomyces globosus]